MRISIVHDVRGSYNGSRKVADLFVVMVGRCKEKTGRRGVGGSLFGFVEKCCMARLKWMKALRLRGS